MCVFGHTPRSDHVKSMIRIVGHVMHFQKLNEMFFLLISILWIPLSGGSEVLDGLMRMSEHVTKCSWLRAGQSSKSQHLPWFPAFQSTYFELITT